jgi:hypothetical protein
MVSASGGPMQHGSCRATSAQPSPVGCVSGRIRPCERNYRDGKGGGTKKSARDSCSGLGGAAATRAPMLPCPSGGDVNGDEAVNSIDALLILQLNVGLIGRLPR